MQVFRFMSKEEFKKYRDSFSLKNDKKHNSKTNSIGFCFFNIEDYTPEEAMHFLSGIVSLDVCVVFETREQLQKTYGVYAKPIKPTGNPFEDLFKALQGWTECFTADEYCTTRYDNKKMKLIKYTENILGQWNPLEEQANFKWVEEN